LLIVAFAAFEWSVATGRLRSQRAALVFPALCAIGGAFLLTHSHAVGDMKEETLIGMSHTPIALLGVTAGWSRWLQLRLSDRDDSRIAGLMGWIWPVCLALVGLILLNYREA
jgi:copper resistance protein D